jgi:hypothetical protein
LPPAAYCDREQPANDQDNRQKLDREEPNAKADIRAFEGQDKTNSGGNGTDSG